MIKWLKNIFSVEAKNIVVPNDQEEEWYEDNTTFTSSEDTTNKNRE